ncbi:hypothetical protein OSTOST_05692 [Ostertagia ostertagi]
MRSQQRSNQGSITKMEGTREDSSDMMPKSFLGKEPGKGGSVAGENHWCYHCVSPLKHISSDMRKTIRQFLHLRRTSYPQEVATDECNNAKNFSRLYKQTCRHPYCSTISLVDHNQGVSFVMRGCAENFGAIDSNFLAKHGDRSCTTLHDHLDMKECLCSEQRYCHSGHSRRRASSFTGSSTFSLALLVALYIAC